MINYCVISGASGGIGSELALLMASEGFHNILIARSKKKLKKLQDTLKNSGYDSTIIQMDLSEPNVIFNEFEHFITKLNNIDVLINNAGIHGPIKAFTDMSKKEYQNWLRTMRLNFESAVTLTYFILPKMLSKNYGRIINMVGRGAASSRKYFSAYSVSKTSLVRFTENLGDELRKTGITINAVSPGGILTEINQEIIDSKEILAGTDDYEDAKKLTKIVSDENMSNLKKFIRFVLSKKSENFSGVFISSKYDDWTSPNFLDHDYGKLRRIDHSLFSKISSLSKDIK